MTAGGGTDRDTRDRVQEELEWTPELDASAIGVSVKNGAVSLAGEVDSFAAKVAATRAAARVRGVRSIVDRLTVSPRSGWPVGEQEIAVAVERALKAAANVPDTINARITGHTVTLAGAAEWEYQRRAARRAVRYLRGVEAVHDEVALTLRPVAHDVADRIRGALARSALVDSGRISVSVSGDEVTLAGVATSWAEKRAAEKAAWASPHVGRVRNLLLVETGPSAAPSQPAAE